LCKEEFLPTKTFSVLSCSGKINVHPKLHLNRKLILAIDVGTSSVRAALYDLEGDLLPRSLVANERSLRSTDAGGSEIDADEAVAQVVSVVDDLVKKSIAAKADIVAVASCAFWHSLVGVDTNGRPTTNVLSWADNRSREHVETLRKKLDENIVHNGTGARFHSSFWPAKLLWLRSAEPAVFAKTAKWLSFSDYLWLKLVGDATTGISMASATGIFDVRKCTWDKELQKFLKITADKLPEIGSETRQLTSKFAKRWPQLANAVWFPPIGDGASSNVGSGCATSSKAALMIGTSGAMRVVYRGEPPREIPSGLWCYRVDRERVVVGGALSDGGGLFKWLRDNLRIDGSIEKEIAKRAADAHGLTFLPFLAGERSTGYHEFATGGIFGITAHTNAVDIAQAAMEAVAYRFAEVFDQLNSVARVKDIIASGGATHRSPVWTQILANVLGRKIQLAVAPEASMRGAVLLALESLGNIESIERISTAAGRTFKPDPKAHSIYKRARNRHQRYYDLFIRNK
jgi:gluconokinase